MCLIFFLFYWPWFTSVKGKLLLYIHLFDTYIFNAYNGYVCHCLYFGSDSSSGRASASGSGGRRFDPRPRHTKGVKNGTGSSLADARNKRVVPGRYKKAGKYLLRILVMSHNSS